MAGSFQHRLVVPAFAFYYHFGVYVAVEEDEYRVIDRGVAA